MKGEDFYKIVWTGFCIIPLYYEYYSPYVGHRRAICRSRPSAFRCPRVVSCGPALIAGDIRTYRQIWLILPPKLGQQAQNRINNAVCEHVRTFNVHLYWYTSKGTHYKDKRASHTVLIANRPIKLLFACLCYRPISLEQNSKTRLPINDLRKKL